MIKPHIHKTKIIRAKNVDKIITDIINKMYQEGPVSNVDLERLAYIKLFHPNIFKLYESKILYLMGLFYKPLKPNSLVEMAYYAYAKDVQENFKNSFTPLQVNMIKNIAEKKYFSFSAPTSSGKSYLFMDLIKNYSNDIVIIVPSRALIAEYLEKTLKLLKDNKDVLVLQFVENINIKHTKRRVFILTPERARELFKYKNLFNIGLFLIDEAQLSEEKLRGLTFDSLIRRINTTFPQATKVFAHPFIKNPEAQFDKHHIAGDCAHQNYKQNSVGKIFLTPVKGDIFAYRPTFKPNSYYYTRNIIKKILQKNDSAILIYASKTKIYNKKLLEEFKEYFELCKNITDPQALEIIKELQEYIGATEDNKVSNLIKMMKKGIVIHHGSIPLKVRFLIEKFINLGYAKICFATSTLLQGINMPFDLVWIDNYRFSGDENKRALELKNLIGRAGRNKSSLACFDYGYVVIPKKNYNNFLERMNIESQIKNSSELDNEDFTSYAEDVKDLVEATRNNTFNDELQITELQKERIKNANLDSDIKFILDNMFIDNCIINASDYKNMDNNIREQVKKSFKNIFVKHLRRNDLTEAEQSVLSVALRILLWRVQGRSFSQIVAFRYNYITDDERRNDLKRQLKEELISEKEYRKQIASIKLKYSQVPTDLPNAKAFQKSLFDKNATSKDFDYDSLVYDTYEYLDTVLSFSLSNPLSAAFQIYYDKTNDYRALSMINCLKYGTNDSKEIMLLRYGFEFEELEWIVPCVSFIDDNEIIFNEEEVQKLELEKRKIINRYYYSNC